MSILIYVASSIILFGPSGFLVISHGESHENRMSRIDRLNFEI